MPRLLAAAFLAVLTVSTGLAAQIDYRPTAAPMTFAADRSWYRSGDPVPFAGDVYYPSGPTVYFNGFSMVPTGEYDGIILYADTTVEPHSLLLVPVSDRLLRPYRPIRPEQQLSTGRLILSPRSVVGATPQEEYESEPTERQEPQEAPPPGWQERERLRPFEQPATAYQLETVRKPNDNIGMWLSFQGRRWRQTGAAVPFDPSRLVSVGQYHDFTVYADSHEPYVIYLPSRENLVAPFRRIEE